ncbi:MAG: immune inhibitor A [Chloroflexota bacterium]
MLRRLPIATAVALCLLSVPISSRVLLAGRNPVHVERGASAAALARQISLPLPARNLYRLANELKLRPPRHIPHVVRTVSPNYPIGHQDPFWILSEDNNHYYQIHAQILAKTPHFYLYIQDGLKVDAAAAQKAAQHFEHSTYPTDRSYFGSEWTPGVDGDAHITCLVANLKSSGVGGYFSAEDQYPTLVYHYSNERKMIYMNSIATLPGQPGFDLTLSHEFQHMIHAYVHPEDNAWLNEGMSMLAEQLNHYAPQGEPQGFITQPDTQLNGWSQDSRLIAHYGAAYLFLSYLYDRFGRSFIHDLVGQSHYTDFELVNSVLQAHHIRLTADQVFAQWVIANLVHDRSIAHGVYGYKQLGFKIDNVTGKLTEAAPVDNQVPPYAAQYTSVELPKDGHTFHVRFSAPATVPVIKASGAPFWWSNRGDMIDTRLERNVNLSRVHHATLRFHMWYETEKDYDYAYVETSADGGKTWRTIPGQHTTNVNPTGGNYGNGYTGTSKGWLDESVDLSRYAGQHIKIRFQYITDDELNAQSVAVNNIRIPEIGLHSTFTGWHSKGWVLVTNNAVPSHWVVQMVSYTKRGVLVSRMPLSSQKQGSILIQPSKDGLQKLVVVVFTTAPKTTVKSPYKLSITAG